MEEEEEEEREEVGPKVEGVEGERVALLAGGNGRRSREERVFVGGGEGGGEGGGCEEGRG